MQVGLPLKRYPTPEKLLAFYQAAERELAAIPGRDRAPRSAAACRSTAGTSARASTIIGDPPVEQARLPSAHYQIVSAGYFRTLGIDVAARAHVHASDDNARATPVCIVNEEFVRRYLAGPRSDRHAASASMTMAMPAGRRRDARNRRRQPPGDGAAGRKGARRSRSTCRSRRTRGSPRRSRCRPPAIRWRCCRR